MGARVTKMIGEEHALRQLKKGSAQCAFVWCDSRPEKRRNTPTIHTRAVVKNQSKQTKNAQCTRLRYSHRPMRVEHTHDTLACGREEPK